MVVFDLEILLHFLDSLNLVLVASKLLLHLLHDSLLRLDFGLGLVELLGLLRDLFLKQDLLGLLIFELALQLLDLLLSVVARITCFLD